MKKLNKAIVATGHPLVSGAAVEILQKGGNAFDAAVGAGFAGAVAEQTLTSLGGGGFLLAVDKKAYLQAPIRPMRGLEGEAR